MSGRPFEVGTAELIGAHEIGRRSAARREE